MEQDQSKKTSPTTKKPLLESDTFRLFKESLEQEPLVEEKLKHTLVFMRDILATSSTISLKDFWDAKRLCPPLFKQSMNPIKRNHLWSEYMELSNEARRFKEVMDEQAAFSIEQIELALTALEGEVEHYDTIVEKSHAAKVPGNLKTFLKCHATYNTTQKELHFLKTFIARLDALRKEVLATDMRIGNKNRLLKRISKLGDTAFPKRKALIKTQSDAFCEDVEAFMKERFPTGQEVRVRPHELREEVKSFQGFAKHLTLNTRTFNRTRVLLSEAWETIKGKEEERKKELEERSEEFQKNFEQLVEKVQEFVRFCEAKETLTREKIVEASDAIEKQVRELPLARHQFGELKGLIQQARTAALDAVQEAIQQAFEADHKKIQELKDACTELLQREAKVSLEQLEQQYSSITERFEQLKLLTIDTYVFQRHFSDLRSFILDKKGEQAQSKEEYEQLFDDREHLYEEVKSQVETYRKEMGSSGLDFEQAMLYRELYDSARIHLDKEVESLQYLEGKLDAD